MVHGTTSIHGSHGGQVRYPAMRRGYLEYFKHFADRRRTARELCVTELLVLPERRIELVKACSQQIAHEADISGRASGGPGEGMPDLPGSR